MAESDVAEYIRSFSASLRRFRTTTIFGWLITTAGFISLAMGWRAESFHEILDLALSCLAMVAGVTVVHVSVQALEGYVQVAMRALQGEPVNHTGTGQSAELLTLMREVRDGGWQEAFTALRKVRTFGGEAEPPRGAAN